MYPSRNSREFLSAQKSILKLLNNPCPHLQLLRHDTFPPYSNSLFCARRRLKQNVEERFSKESILTVKLFEAK